jgi:sodium/hydrogen antiporter
MEFVTAFGLVAAVLTASALAAGLVERAPLSFPMIFLGLGFLLGPGALDVVRVDLDGEVLELLATLTLALILFLDAVNLEPADNRRDWLVPALALGPGTVLVVGMVAGTASLLLDFPPLLAFMLGAVLSSTDPVVLRDVVRDRRLPGSVRRALSVEAATNDIVVLPILLVLLAVSRSDAGGAGDWAAFAAKVFLLGPAAGFAVGAAGAFLMARVDARFAIRREYQSIYGVGLVLGSYAAGVAVGGDGFLAAFAAGMAVTLLNQELCDCFMEFGQAAAEMAMLFAFVLFGSLLSATLGAVDVLPALGLTAVTIFIARPLAIWLVLHLRAAAVSGPARGFIAWFGPRGLNSLLFAVLVVRAGVPGAEALLAATGVVVVVSVVLHGASTTPLAAWYSRRVERETLSEERVDTASGLFEAAPEDAPRVSVEDVVRWLGEPDPPIVMDVRSRSQYMRDRVRIPGSVRVLLDDVGRWAATREPGPRIVAYCT